MKSTVIPVVGMHRAGTSAVARGIKALGAELGNRLMPAKAAENPKGFWEDLDILGLDELVLKAVGLSSWNSVRLVDPGVWEGGGLDALKDSASALISSKFGGCPLWSFKDPRTARLLPFWKDVFNRAGMDAGYVLVVRNPISVARSLAARNAMPAEKAHLLWLEHMLPAFLDTAGERRVVLDFDLLMAAPERQLERVAARLDIPVTEPVRAEISAFAKHFLVGEYRHTVFGADAVEADPAVCSLTRRAFAILDRLARDGSPTDDAGMLGAMRGIAAELAGMAPLCRFADDLESAHETLRRDLAQSRRAIRGARHEAEKAREECEALRGLRHEALVALEQMRGSLSWRVTAPLRQGSAAARALLRPAAAPPTGAAAVPARPAFTFPLPDADPEVSLIVPADGPGGQVYACLRSVLDARPHRSYEVIVVESGATAADAGHDAIGGILLLRDEGPPGRLGALNRAARAARGRYLLFMDPETLAAPGWLDELVSAFEHNPDAGLAGSKIVGADGRLREAGREIRGDGSLAPRGAGDDPERPEHNWLRTVDCCSLASAMVPRGVFQDIGGFDEGYPPGAAAEADFALALQERGRAVLYQPLSRVVRVGDAGTGVDDASLSRLRGKWAGALARREAPGGGARARRLLVIDAMTPTPDKDAGSVDVVSYLRIFRSLSYDVTFIPESQLQHGGEYTAALQRLGVECLYEPHVASVRGHLEAEGPRYDLVMIYRAPTAARHIDDVRRLCPNAKVVFNTVDLHYLREEREATLEGSEQMAAGAARTKEAELSVIARSDCTIVLSTAERQILGAEPAASGRRIAVMPLIIPVPGRSAPFEGRRDVVFVGGFRHRPNVDAAVYFTREIWPLVRPRLRASRFLVVGSHPPPEILALRGDGIVVAGHVGDLGPLFAACRLSVAPIRYGAGIKGKVLTSMSYGVPCVATTMAVEGGDYRDGENVLVADAPQQFADAVVRAHGDETLWNRLSDRGLAFVEQSYSLDAGRARIEALVAGLS